MSGAVVKYYVDMLLHALQIRDGINRAHSHNLIYGKPADYQCDGYNSTSMEHNTIIQGTVVTVVSVVIGSLS